MPTPSDTLGQRQARRFYERKGYARHSLHNYRPHKAMFNFTAWKRDVMPFWYLGTAQRKRNAKRRLRLLPWLQHAGLVDLGCYWDRKRAGLV